MKLATVCLAVAATGSSAHAAELTEADVTALVETYGPWGGVDDAGDIEVVIEDGADGTLATVEPKEGGGCTLTVYPDQFEQTYPSTLGSEGLSGSTGEGLLAPEIIHEMMHKCKEDSGDTDACSCNHFLIDYSVAVVLCEILAELEQAIADADTTPDSQEEIDLQNKRSAMCDAHRRLRDKWASEEKRFKAGDCRRCREDEYGDAVGAGCGLTMPPAPPNGDADCSDPSDPTYPDTPIPPCPWCGA